MERMDDADDDVEKRDPADDDELDGMRSASDAAAEEVAVVVVVLFEPTALELRTLRRDVRADRG